MDLKQRFAEELRYLRELGREFAEDNPQLAQFLGDQAGDPDVERLLEGFAFLTAKLGMKIDDDLPELTHPLLQMLWPNYLRPLPSATIIRFTPLPDAISQRQVIPKGTPVFAKPVDGISCQFRTCTDVNLYPLALQEVSDAHSREASVMRIDLKVLTEQPLTSMACDQLDFHLGGDNATAMTLYLWLAHYLDSVTLHIDKQSYRLPAKAIGFPGFTAEEALLPYPRNVFDGYRILQEYFVFPQRFHFFSLTQLARVWPEISATSLRFEFQFSRPMPPDIRLRTSDLHLYCAPAVNLFRHDANPIALDGRSLERRISPAATAPRPSKFSVSITWPVGMPPTRSAKAIRCDALLHSNRSSMRSNTRGAARHCISARISKSPTGARACVIASLSCAAMKACTSVSMKQRPSN